MCSHDRIYRHYWYLLNLFFLLFNIWLIKKSKSSIDLKPLIIWIKMVFLSFYFRKNWHLSEYTRDGLFEAYPEILPPLKQVWSLGFLCSSLQRFWSVFLFDFLKWPEFNPLPDLLNSGFTIIEIGLLYGSEHLAAKLCRFLSFFFDKMAMFAKWATMCENTSNIGWVLLILH